MAGIKLGTGREESRVDSYLPPKILLWFPQVVKIPSALWLLPRDWVWFGLVWLVALHPFLLLRLPPVSFWIESGGVILISLFSFREHRPQARPVRHPLSPVEIDCWAERQRLKMVALSRSFHCMTPCRAAIVFNPVLCDFGGSPYPFYNPLFA